MTNLHDWLSIGIPSGLVVLSSTSNSLRLSPLEKRFNRVNVVDSRTTSVADSHHRDMLRMPPALVGFERVALVESRQA